MVDDLELERLMAEAAPARRDEAFVLAVLAGVHPRGFGRLAGLLEGAVVVSGLGLAWKGLEALPPAVGAGAPALQTAGAAAISVVLLWMAVARRGLAV